MHYGKKKKTKRNVWSNLEKVKMQKEQREKRQHNGNKRNWNMLYTISESTHTNTSPAKGKIAQNNQGKIN